MKKFINSGDMFVEETIEGILLAHPDKLRAVNGNLRVIGRNDSVKKGKVGIVTGGGSGHLPVFLGYVGKGMADVCAVGNVFASPSAQVMYESIKAADNGSGVLCLFGNYGGDSMNFEMACDMAAMDGIRCEMIKVADDVASAPADRSESRRGVAGLVPAYKVAGAAAEMMMDLDQVCSVTRKALANIRSMGAALGSCILPQVGKPTFTVDEDKVEVGMGIHGEPGIESRRIMTADEVVELLLGKITADMPLKNGDEAFLLVNGLGATPLEELYICFRRAYRYLTESGVKLHSPYIGEFATSMEMAGMSITVMKLDDQLKPFIDYPANTPFFTNANK